MSPARARALTLPLLAAALAGLAGCSSDRNVRTLQSGPVDVGMSAPIAAARAVPVAASPDPASTPDVASAAAVARPAPAVAPIPVIQVGATALTTGAKGGNVQALEDRLSELRFNPGKRDGAYDSHTLQAVMAFQKQQGLPRTGKADQATLTAVSHAGLGEAMVSTGEATRVEIDLQRQVAQFWAKGDLVRVLPISSGNGERYCVPKDKGGGCDVAVTPGGSYRADRKIQGIRVSKLGQLYDPVYFNGGIAIHGSPSVPAGPASHGCIRVPMWESRWVHDNVAIGDPVYVVGGKVAPVPFGETAPDDVEGAALEP